MGVNLDCYYPLTDYIDGDGWIYEVIDYFIVPLGLCIDLLFRLQ